MHNAKTWEAIMTAETLIEYCKDHTNTCKDCPFYARNNSEWTGCLLACSIPEDWEIEAHE